ncbi:MAG: GTP-dependent dephospho-CoA kinase family protein [Nitrososphaerales archaeon]
MPRVYRLPEDLRTELAKPIGRLFPAAEVDGRAFANIVMEAPMVITVGDRVTETLGALGRVPDVQVVDSRENRKERTPPDVAYARRIKVENPPGTITEDAIDGIREALRGRKPVRVAVRGEEDLLAIPVIALAPVSALVFYGQPGEGIVVVKADAGSKSRNRAILAEIGISEIR